MSLARRVERLFQDEGPLARAWPHWEERPGQRSLAVEVAHAIERGGVLLAEAPTGVGKSLAYLLPAMLHAAGSGERVVVATCTRSLQDQLHERDVPALLDALGLELTFAVLKGKQNYLCPRALELESPAEDGAEEDGDGGPAAARGVHAGASETLQHELLESLREWAARDPSGDLDRFDAFDGDAFRRLRARVATDPAACTAATCRRGRECFWLRARRRAAEARLLIVNHALLARAAGADGLLPPYDVLIVDEAHRLEGVLSAQLARVVSRHRIEELLRLTGTFAGGRRGTGLLARMRAFALPLLGAAPARERLVAELERLDARAEAARADADALFTRLAVGGVARDGGYARRVRHHDMESLLGRDLQPLEVVLEHARTFADVLRRAASGVQLAANGGSPAAGARGGSMQEELEAELETVSARWMGVHDDLAALADAGDRDWAYWRSQGAQSRVAELHAAPVWVGEHARRLVAAGPRAAVLTSATLSAAGDFTWAADRLGLGEDHGAPYASLTVPSPFPLAQQMRAYILAPAGSPGDVLDEAEAIAVTVAELSRIARRNTLVLFTAHERLRRAHARLRTLLAPGLPLLAQDRDGTAGRLSERFRAERGAVLLGVQSLWEGVDFPGEALEVLVVARLPFSVPDDPVVEARGERLRERGLEPFRHDAVPEAVMRFRQGVGRLIRRATDRGVLVVCDARLARASYRGPFLAALPVEPTLWNDPRGLAREAGEFLGSMDAARMEEG
jgi:ATP-dependent DNA helicase DinG